MTTATLPPQKVSPARVKTYGKHRRLTALPSVLDCIGRTPLVRLDRLCPRRDIELAGKLELMNPGGSIKDRTALSLLTDGLAEGHIEHHTTIVESTSGNLGIGLAQACSVLKLKLRIVVDPLTNPSALKLIRLYGAQVEVVTPLGPEETFLEARLRRVREILSEDPHAFWINQYRNWANPEAHHTTMAEIQEQAGGPLDRIYAATSTCGTLVGCMDYLSSHDLPTEVCAVDAMGSSIFQPKSKASQHQRKLPGHGSARKSDFLEGSSHSPLVSHVSDLDCVAGCRRLLETEGILAGASSGGVVSAFLRDVETFPAGSRVALILCDRGDVILKRFMMIAGSAKT